MCCATPGNPGVCADGAGSPADLPRGESVRGLGGSFGAALTAEALLAREEQPNVLGGRWHYAPFRWGADGLR